MLSATVMFGKRAYDWKTMPTFRWFGGLSVMRGMGSSSASWVSIAFGARGPCFVVASACASATHAIGVAAQLVRAGVVDVAITGGTEAPLSRGTLMAWNAMKIMSRTGCRPFSRDRVIDLSYAAAVKLGVHNGVAPVEVERITYEEIRAGLAAAIFGTLHAASAGWKGLRRLRAAG